MPKPLPHHWRKLTSHKLSSANDVGQASTIPRNSYVVTVKNGLDVNIKIGSSTRYSR